jgi:hypothetical protein
MDVQSICQVQHILNLSRDAIKNGAVTVSTDQAFNLSLATSLEVSLGNITKNGVALTINELAALYWLFRSDQPPSSPDQRKKAAAALSALTPPPLLASGDTNPAFKQVARVSSILATIPPALASKLDATVQAGASGARAAPVAEPGAPGVASAVRPPGRISVGIMPVQ